MAEQDIPPPTITAMKILIIRKGEYDIWSMRMRQYICHTDHNLCNVIVNKDLEEEPAPTIGETFAPSAPKTTKQLAARRNQERVKMLSLPPLAFSVYMMYTSPSFTMLLMLKALWGQSNQRFSGNIPETISQLRFLGCSNFHKKTINRSSLELPLHGIRDLPLIMRNKLDIVDEIDIDDLYNNHRVYEDELKRSSGSNSASQNLAFLSSKNTGGTNEVSTASRDFGVSTTGGINQVPSTLCAHDVAMLTVKVKKFIQRTGRNLDFKEKQLVSLDKSKIECYNCHRKWHFARECISRRNQRRRSYGDNGRSNALTNESSSQALVAQDGLGGYNCSNDFEVEPVNYALMTISSSSSSSSFDSEVQKCSKQCLESFKTLQKNYDTEREKHNKAKLEIRGYEIALESLESRILGHEKNELAW
ncbi:ribonuclease H-like domain-containing protein, partial [Tanacetum coccineum]